MYKKIKIKNIINISEIISIYFFEFDKEYKFPGESHDFWEMVYVDMGKVEVNTDYGKNIVESGEVLFHKPNEFHDIASYNNKPANVFIISFSCKSAKMNFFREKLVKVPDYLKNLISSIINEATFSFNTNTISINHAVNYILTPENAIQIGSLQLIKIYLEQFLILLFREQQNTINSNKFYIYEYYDDQLIGKIVTYLHEHICDNISLEELSAEMFFTKSYLCNTFKKHTGKTIIEYYNQLKINEAKKLIRENRFSLTQISQMLSFDNQNYFSKIFKKYQGVSPSLYIKSVKKT